MPSDWMAAIMCPQCPSDSAEVAIEHMPGGTIAKLIFTCTVCGYVTVDDYSKMGISPDKDIQ